MSELEELGIESGDFDFEEEPDEELEDSSQ